MSQDDLAERLDAVERRLDAAYPEPTEGAVDGDTVERVERFAERLADLEAAVEAVEGYVGEIERVDEELERRADAALATADDLEDRVDSIEAELAAVPSRRDPDLDDRLAEQTAALEELRSEVGSLDDRVGALEPDATDDEAPVTDRGLRDRTEQCTCTDPTPTDFDAGSAPDRGHRSAADGGFERADRSAASTDADGWTAPGESGLGSEPTVPDDTPDPGRSPADPGRPTSDPGRSHSDTNDRPGHPDREPEMGQPTGHGRTARTRPSNGGTSVTGWGSNRTDSPRQTDTAPGSASGDPAAHPPDSDDRSWTDASSETLLDRLRSLL